MMLFFAALTFFTFSNPQIASKLASSLEQQYPQVDIDNLAKHDAIIVLGGGLRIPLPPAKTVQLGDASDRYWYAAQLFKANKADQIILSGGNVYKQDGFQGESYYATQLLQAWGVPANRIRYEANSRTTKQNFEHASDMLLQYQAESAILVTSALHMPRALRLFQKLPIPVTPASTDVIVRQSQAPSWTSWMPSASALRLSTVALHEYYGQWFDQLKSWWKS